MAWAIANTTRYKRMEAARKRALYAEYVEAANKKKREEKKEVPRGT